ncbi:hypothetical protein G6F66_015481 [Rhizopus arrhizus]|nr:hypothetical protein G6F66_015481 [Rhizopus arrhizus]
MHGFCFKQRQFVMCTRIDLGAGLAVQGIPLRLGTGPGTRHKPQPLRGGLHRVGLRRAHQLGELVPTQLEIGRAHV